MPAEAAVSLAVAPVRTAIFGANESFSETEKEGREKAIRTGVDMSLKKKPKRTRQMCQHCNLFRGRAGRVHIPEVK
jgi:hypothetical protein